MADEREHSEVAMLRRALSFDRPKRDTSFDPKVLRIYKDRSEMPLGLRFIDPLGEDAHKVVHKELGTLAVIEKLVPDGLASSGGLKIGDRVVSINDRHVDGPAQAAAMLRECEGYVRLEVLPRALEPGSAAAARALAETAALEAARADSAPSSPGSPAPAVPSLGLSQIRLDDSGPKATGDGSSESSGDKSEQSTPRQHHPCVEVPHGALCAVTGSKNHVRLSGAGSAKRLSILNSPGKSPRSPASVASPRSPNSPRSMLSPRFAAAANSLSPSNLKLSKLSTFLSPRGTSWPQTVLD